MLIPGLYPAAVTPMDSNGAPDYVSLARLLAHFEAAGCTGAVIAGTNGEGPSLSAPEKRDLLRAAISARGRLLILLGIATPSLDEALWLSSQAAKLGANGLLVMPPGYFRAAAPEGVRKWFVALADASEIPILVYNFPKMTGITLDVATAAELGAHPRIAGLKDSSGDPANLAAYRAAMTDDKLLFVGDETLLLQALEHGWSGSISGASNSIAPWLSRILGLYASDKEQCTSRFEYVLPLIERLRSEPQPAMHKAVLHALGVLATPCLRLPLLSSPQARVEELMGLLTERLGIAPGPACAGYRMGSAFG